MEFFGALITMFTSWFGGGVTEVPTPPVVVEERQVVIDEAFDIDEPATEDNTIEVDSETEEPESVAESEPVESEPAPEPEVALADDAGAMVGNAKPIETTTAPTADIRTMLVAGGCFWCVEADMEKTPGVISAVSGYAGGTTENPTYQDYGSGGHREVVEVTYDANQVSFEDILIVTMKTTDPTDDDGTFNDRGDKYSAAFYYETAEQKAIIDNLIEEVDEFGPYDAPLAIDVEERPVFWEAEDFHQDYYKGLFTQVKYNAYRIASGRTAFIEKYWGVNDHSAELSWREETTSNNQTYMWSNYQKPSKDELKTTLDALTFKVTQEDGTERAGTSPLDKIYEDGIYVDVLSGEPLFSSRDKFDSGTGWPSFSRPITEASVTEHEDRKLFVTRTEIRSAIADNHLGHVFADNPLSDTGLRYCMNGVSLEFIPKAEMEERGYGDFIQYI